MWSPLWLCTFFPVLFCCLSRNQLLQLCVARTKLVRHGNLARPFRSVPINFLPRWRPNRQISYDSSANRVCLHRLNGGYRSKSVPLSRQRKKRDGLRLSFAIPTKQWASDRLLLRLLGYGKPLPISFTSRRRNTEF